MTRTEEGFAFPSNLGIAFAFSRSVLCNRSTCCVDTCAPHDLCE